jgi:hypothetical protein
LLGISFNANRSSRIHGREGGFLIIEYQHNHSVGSLHSQCRGEDTRFMGSVGLHNIGIDVDSRDLLGDLERQEGLEEH